MTIKGLSEAEVAARIAAGKVNTTKSKTLKTSDIVKKHSITLFNILNIVLAILCFIAGNPKETLFLWIIFVNTAIAIVNDIRAKRVVEKLSLLAEEKATVLRTKDGKSVETKIPIDEIVKGDILKFQLGDQIPVDSKVVDGFLEVNESFVTGESDTIRKDVDADLISGSFVISGLCYARAVSVGEENFTNKLLSSAKKIKANTSQLISTLNKIIKIISFILIPIGILFFINQFKLETATFSSAISSTVSALLSMIPEGLVLLTSSVLALATIRLSKKKVLVQDLYSIETLARVDTICLDKTGTLTTGNLKVEKIIPLEGSSEKEISDSIRKIIGNLTDNNATYHALEKNFGKDTTEKAKNITPFSSERKYSGVTLKNFELRMGAYEFMTKNRDFLEEEQEYAKEFRVITVMKLTETEEKVLGFVLLSDELRENSKKLLDYFSENDVDVKIISGDNLATIEKICQKLGRSDLKAFDMSKETSHDYASLVRNYSIFARVRPEEKRSLIKALERAGHIVAMTGDGVNDVLALKEASCGISIGDGADAAKRVSHLVLLDNDFDNIPEVIREGRRSINNINRSSSLFLTKTIYATILSIIFIFLDRTYPFTPLEMGIANFILIGAPSFLLALEPNYSRVTTKILDNVREFSLPTAFTVVTVMLSLVLFSENLPFTQIVAFSAFLLYYIGFSLVYRISKPFNNYKKSVYIGLILTLIIIYSIPVVRRFYELEFIEWGNIFRFILYLLETIILEKIFKKLVKKITLPKILPKV